MLEQRKKIILGFPKSEKALDLGCGTGLFFNLISQKNKHIWGIDISKRMLEKANEKIKQEKLSNIILTRGNAYSLPFENYFFNRVYCINTFCHIKDSKKVIEEISRVLKHDGIAYIEFYDINNLFVFVRVLTNFFLKNHGLVYGNHIPTLKKQIAESGLKVTDFKVVSYVETSDAIKKWLPSFLFTLLRFYEQLSKRFSLLQFTRCIIELRKQ